jgi:hypothetical protein
LSDESNGEKFHVPGRMLDIRLGSEILKILRLVRIILLTNAIEARVCTANLKSGMTDLR